jgi:hypothetical protein
MWSNETTSEASMQTPLTWLIAGILLGCCSAAAAEDSQIERTTLTGLTPISVVVEELAPVAQANGLSSGALQADAERRLRQAGISVTPDADAYLYVHVTAADPGPSSPVPYFVEVTLMQEVTLPRGVHTQTALQCPTWWLNRLGLISPNLLRTSVTDRVDEFVDQFIRAYRSVNPKT